VKMSVAVAKDPQRRADLNLDPQLLAQLAPQTGGGRLATPAFPAGNSHNPPRLPSGRRPISTRPRCRITPAVAMRCGAAGLRERTGRAS
jgi:hypothetical protein